MRIMRRREFLSSAAAAAAGGAPELRLIAHRGGVVGPTRAENSEAAVRAAIERKYWMIEVDVRQTRDGEPVLYHDNTLEKYFGTGRRVEESTWAELRGLKSKIDAKPVLHFDQACALCGPAGLRLMLDLKGQWEPAFYLRLLRYMTENRIARPIWSLGGARVLPLFGGQVMVSANRQSLEAAAAAGRPVARENFLFELGSELSAESFSLANRLGVVPVAAINTFRYTMAKRDEWEGPKEDIATLRALGVASFQIDSRYEPLFKTGSAG